MIDWWAWGYVAATAGGALLGAALWDLVKLTAKLWARIAGAGKTGIQRRCQEDESSVRVTTWWSEEDGCFVARISGLGAMGHGPTASDALGQARLAAEAMLEVVAETQA